MIRVMRQVGVNPARHEYSSDCSPLRDVQCSVDWCVRCHHGNHCCTACTAVTLSSGSCRGSALAANDSGIPGIHTNRRCRSGKVTRSQSSDVQSICIQNLFRIIPDHSCSTCSAVVLGQCRSTESPTGKPHNRHSIVDTQTHQKRWSDRPCHQCQYSVVLWWL